MADGGRLQLIKDILVILGAIVLFVVIPITIETIIEKRRIRRYESIKRSKKDD
jgi:hypothetical protein